VSSGGPTCNQRRRCSSARRIRLECRPAIPRPRADGSGRRTYPDPGGTRPDSQAAWKAWSGVTSRLGQGKSRRTLCKLLTIERINAARRMDDFVHEASDLCLVREVYLEPSDSSELNGIPTVQIMEAPADTNAGTTVCPSAAIAPVIRTTLPFISMLTPALSRPNQGFHCRFGLQAVEVS